MSCSTAPGRGTHDSLHLTCFPAIPIDLSQHGRLRQLQQGHLCILFVVSDGSVVFDGVICIYGSLFVFVCGLTGAVVALLAVTLQRRGWRKLYEELAFMHCVSHGGSDEACFVIQSLHVKRW